MPPTIRPPRACLPAARSGYWPRAYERLSEQSRYRRFFTHKNELSAAELDCFVDVDHTDREAIIAIEPSSGELLGVARYIRSDQKKTRRSPRSR